MTTAQRILVGYGTSVMLLGLLLGTVLGMLRMKAPSVRNLATAHVETLMQAALHFGLAFAVGTVGFESGAATWAAWLLVIGSGMQAMGVTLNWLTKTGDQFAERSPGFVINAVSTYVVWPGAILAAWGVFTRL